MIQQHIRWRDQKIVHLVGTPFRSLFPTARRWFPKRYKIKLNLVNVIKNPNIIPVFLHTHHNSS